MSGSTAKLLSSKRERFDIDSGQVYKETIIKAAPRPTWIDPESYLNVVFDENRKRADKGAPSLEDIAVRSFLRNIHAVTFDTLLGLPWGIGRRLWKLVEELDLVRPSIWWAFAAAFPTEEQFRYYRACEIIPTKTFPEYIEYLSCPGFEWLTCLTLSKISLGRADIMRVSELTNLVGLDVIDAGPSRGVVFDADTSSVDDQVLRNWGRRAQESGSFSKLRVIILRNQRHVTPHSLQYLHMFPALTLFGISGCAVSASNGDTAQEHGWTLDDSRGVLTKIKSDIDKSHTWDGALVACVKHSAGLHSATSTDADVKDPPTLSYRVGHTSSEVLYSIPLVFFRCFEREESDAYDDDLSTSTTDPHIVLANSSGPLSRGHLDKKRKIKMSAQRSFDSTLVDLGIDLASRPVAPPKSTSDTSISTMHADTAPAPAAEAVAAEDDATRGSQSFTATSSSPLTPSCPIPWPLSRRRQSRQDRDRPWRQSPGKKS